MIYQELDDLISAVQFDGSDAQAFDTSCFSGEYVTGDVTSSYLEFIERKRNDAAKAKKEIERKQIDIQDQSSMTLS